ncbi:MAG TPA: alpha-ketoglutarate-dependent dioxygenase AlkB [Candidatus Rubrimentiphilum sp.]|nr:alpha-ketoglutarate-dependent dioxygenase AlkB [Candidatus Rubrimentiphilum sp.]
MQQLALFGAGERVFADDESGTFAYYPALLDAAESRRLFEHLSQSLTWSQDSMWMYDHTVAVPRLHAHFAEGESLPEHVEEARARVERRLNDRFNSVHLQYYRDANDSVSWHSDHTEDLIDQGMVAIVSLGAVREMRVRSKSRPRRTFTCLLEPGSLFVMAGRAQEFWEHHIPKLRQPVTPRISITFRQKR